MVQIRNFQKQKRQLHIPFVAFTLLLSNQIAAQQIFSTSESTNCRFNCIDKEKVFCNSDSENTGTCYETQASSSKQNICSYEALLPTLQLYACPFSQNACGNDKLIVVSSSGVENTLTPGSNYISDFKEGAVCGFQFRFPNVAGPTDEMVIKVDTKVRATVNAFQALKYSDNTAVQLEINTGETLRVIYPDTVYIIITADIINSAGYFGLKYKFIDKDPTPEEIEQAEQKVERQIIVETEYVEVESSFTESAEFKIILALIALTVVLIIFLVIYLYKQNQKNMRIRSKIVMLQSAQRFDGKIMTKEQVEQQKNAKGPSAKPFIGEEEAENVRNTFVKAQISSILNDQNQQTQFNQMFADYLKLQEKGGSVDVSNQASMRPDANGIPPANYQVSPNNLMVIQQASQQQNDIKRDQTIDTNFVTNKTHNGASQSSLNTQNSQLKMYPPPPQQQQHQAPINKVNATEVIISSNNNNNNGGGGDIIKPNRLVLPPIATSQKIREQTPQRNQPSNLPPPAQFYTGSQEQQQQQQQQQLSPHEQQQPKQVKYAKNQIVNQDSSEDDAAEII